MKKYILMIRYFKSGEYRDANYMFYCEDCESYSRNYQIELKKLSSPEYNKALLKSEYGEFSDICPHCLSENVTIIGHNDVKHFSKPWLDYDSKAPKLTLKEFVSYIKTIEVVRNNRKVINDTEEFLKHNKLVPSRLDKSEEVQMDVDNRDEFLKELNELSNRYNMFIGGCDCCDSPYVENVNGVELLGQLEWDRKNQEYRHKKYSSKNE